MTRVRLDGAVVKIACAAHACANAATRTVVRQIVRNALRIKRTSFDYADCFTAVAAGAAGAGVFPMLANRRNQEIDV